MKILKDGSIYILGEILTKAMPFLLLPYLTRKLGVDGFGELSYYQAFIAFFLIFLGLSQHGAIARYYYFYGKKAINMVVTSGYLINGFTAFVLIVIFAFFKAKMMIYVTLAAMFQSLIDVQLSLRQCQKKPIAYVIVQLFYSGLNVLLTVVLLELFSEHLVEKRLLAMLLSGLIAFLLSYYFYLRTLNQPFRYSKRQYKIGMRYIFFFGLPLFLHGLSGVVRGQFDRVLIYNNFSEAELGIYSAGFQVASILSVVIMAMNKAIVPYYYEWLKQKRISRVQIVKYFFLSFLFIPIPALVAWVIPESFYVLFLGDGFNDSKYFTVLFLLNMAINIPYLILVNYLFYYGKNVKISTASVVSTVVYVVFLLVIMAWGVKYLPYAGILASLFILPILYFFCIRTDSDEIASSKNKGDL